MPVPAVWGWATQGSPLALSAPGVGHENDTDLPQGCFNNWNPTVVGFIFVLIHIHILYLNFQKHLLYAKSRARSCRHRDEKYTFLVS